MSVMRDLTRMEVSRGRRKPRPPPTRHGPAPSPYFQNPNIPTNHYSQSPNFFYQPSNSQSDFNPTFTQQRQGVLERIDREVEKARAEVLAAGGHVSAWEVSQMALIRMKTESWESLGVQMQQVPSFRCLIGTEGKINAFIHCFVAVRKITSLHDLDAAICANEGIERYEELELGPLAQHPLAKHYFSLSPDVKDIVSITSEEVISDLCEFLHIQKGSRIEIDEFLDFSATKKSISGREKLGVRIQSLGTHITFICQAKRLEIDTMKKWKQPRPTSKKGQLDEHFTSSLAKGFGGTGKHTKFVSSSSEEEFVSPGNIFSHNAGSSDQPRRCPYPSEAEERSGLGLKKADMDINPFLVNDSLDCAESQKLSKRKRKLENGSSKTISRAQLRQMRRESKKEFNAQDEAVFSLDFNSLRMFIMKWKKSCRDNTIPATFQWMLESHGVKKQRKKAKVWLSSHPFVELLNVAVISIARGMWDGIHVDFDDFVHQGVADAEPEKHTIYESIEVEAAEKDAVETANCYIKHVAIDDVVQKVSTFFEPDRESLSNVEFGLEPKIRFLRKLCKCEFWLSTQYSTEKFKSLGYGKFFMFVKKHVSLLHNTFQKCFADETKKPILEVCMLEHQLDVILSQAANNCSEDKTMTKDMVPPLLTRQFPLVNFMLADRGLHENFMDDVRKKGKIFSCILFSASLLTKHREDTISEKDSLGVGETHIGYKDKIFGSVTTDDAIKVLHRAPMLSDLITWIHWDIFFAPSLGPLVRWLLNVVNVKELMCLVTKDGKVIKIDHTASLDSFFQACLQGSSFRTAVELLSILSIYGGEAHVPWSLLKCHARQAFEALIKNSGEIENHEKSLLCRQ